MFGSKILWSDSSNTTTSALSKDCIYCSLISFDSIAPSFSPRTIKTGQAILCKSSQNNFSFDSFYISSNACLSILSKAVFPLHAGRLTNQSTHLSDNLVCTAG